MTASGACSQFVRIFWPVILSMTLPTVANQLLSLDAGNWLLTALADLLNGIAQTQPGGYQPGRKLSALEALFL